MNQYRRITSISVAIHSNSPEMIHILEDCNICPPDGSYEQLYAESAKCHHNKIARYIHDNFLEIQEKDFTEKTVRMILGSFNYCYPENFNDIKIFFFYLCSYGYKTLYDLYLQPKMEELNNRKLSILNLFFFNQEEISNYCF